MKINNEHLISIITPTYNHESYIKKCIESVIDQEYENWELHIVNDNSRDNTRKILSNYENNPKINIYDTNGFGPKNLDKVYNLAFNKCRGSYIAILEGDDYWPKSKLDIQIRYMENNPNAIVSYGHAPIINESGQIVNLGLNGFKNINKNILNNKPRGLLLDYLSNYKNFIPAVSVIIKSDVLKQINGFKGGKGTLQVDYPTWCHLSLLGEFLYIPHTLGYWRRHSESITTDKILELEKGKYNYMNYFLDLYEENTIVNYKKLKSNAESYDYELNSRIQQAKHYLIFKDFKKAKQLFKKLLAEKMSINILVGYISSVVRYNLFELIK